MGRYRVSCIGGGTGKSLVGLVVSLDGVDYAGHGENEANDPKALWLSANTMGSQRHTVHYGFPKA